MNWQDERYVRAYTRDTLEWLALPWESRAIWFLILRRMDRSGVLEVRPGPTRLQMVSIAIGVPVEVVGPGVAGLIADGCLVESDIGFVAPNFLEAQEALASDNQRQRESRARRRAKGLIRTRVNGHEEWVTKCDPLSDATVTKCDPSENTNNLTIEDSSEWVTRGHAWSHVVTPSLAVPSLAVPKRNDAELKIRPDLAPKLEESAPETRPLPLLSLVASEAPRKRGRPKKSATEPKGQGPHVPLLEAWKEVYLEKTGKTYPASVADWKAAHDLHIAGGVTPERVKEVSRRTFRLGIQKWCQVSSFRELVSKFTAIELSKIVDSKHNAATKEEHAADLETNRAMYEGEL